VVSTLRQAAERSLAKGAAEAAVEYLTRALDEQVDPPARAEVLVELGLAERRTNGPAAVDHLRAALELLTDRSRRCTVALELGRALWFTDRIADALAVFQHALDEVDRERDPGLYELLLAELISSAWWDAQTYPIAEAAIGELDLDALHGGLGSEILLATMAHYEDRLGLHRERAIDLARRALAPGNLLASGSMAFYYAVNVLHRSGLLATGEALRSANQAQMDDGIHLRHATSRSRGHGVARRPDREGRAGRRAPRHVLGQRRSRLRAARCAVRAGRSRSLRCLRGDRRQELGRGCRSVSSARSRQSSGIRALRRRRVLRVRFLD
jgi:tetratricopeptide (TPR) repeat protein